MSITVFTAPTFAESLAKTCRKPLNTVRLCYVQVVGKFRTGKPHIWTILVQFPYKVWSFTFSQNFKTEVKGIVRKAVLNSISKWFGSHTAVERRTTSKNSAICGQLQRFGVNLSGQTTKILVVGRQKVFQTAQHVQCKLCWSYVLVTWRQNTYLDCLCVKFTFGRKGAVLLSNFETVWQVPKVKLLIKFQN